MHKANRSIPKMIDSGRAKSAGDRNTPKTAKTGKRLVPPEFVTTVNKAFEPKVGGTGVIDGQTDDSINDEFSESSTGVFSPTLDEIFSPPTTDALSSRQVAANRLSSLESQMALVRTTVEGFPSYITQFEAIEEEFSSLRKLESVPGQLKEVECRLEEVERFLGAEHAALAAVTEKVETIGLALEVVEQSLEYFEETDETLDSLRSRMDDFDVGMEKSEHRVDELVRKMEDLQQGLKAAHDLAETASADINDLKHGVSLMSSGASTPAGTTISERSSSARVKAAVHTLSDGYRSLHKAMNLMYDEQTDLATRVARVGAEVQRMPAGGRSRWSKIRADMDAPRVASFPLDDFSDIEDDVDGYEGSRVDTGVLTQATAMDLSRNDRRVEALEAEVRYLRDVLSKLVCGIQEPEDLESDQPGVKATLTICEDGSIRLHLSQKKTAV